MKDRVIRTTQQKGFKLFIQEKAQWMLFKLDMLIKNRLEYIVLYMRVYTANYDFTPPFALTKQLKCYQSPCILHSMPKEYSFLLLYVRYS